MDKQTLVHPYNGTPCSNQSVNQSIINYWHAQQEPQRYYDDDDDDDERSQFQKVIHFYMTFWKSKTIVMEKRSYYQRLPVGRGFDYEGTTYFVSRLWWWPHKSIQVLKLTEMHSKKIVNFIVNKFFKTWV